MYLTCLNSALYVAIYPTRLIRVLEELLVTCTENLSFTTPLTSYYPFVLVQDLHLYKLPSNWSPSAPFIVQSIWFCIGSPLLSNRFVPGSFWRVFLLRLFGCNILNKCRIKPGFRVKYPWKLSIGFACWLGEDVWIDNVSDVYLSDRVCISQGAYLCTGNHNYKLPTFDLISAPIHVGSDVWIGAKAVVAPGVSLSDNCVVCLSSVVLSDIPPFSIAQGNPARVVGTR